MTVGNLTEIARRKRSQSIEHRSKLASSLRASGQRILSGGCSVKGYILVTIDEDDRPYIWWDGLENWDDLSIASAAIRDVMFKDDPAKAVKEGHDRRVNFRRSQQRLKARIKEEKPWVCDYCPRRFRTERGANQHERSCWMREEEE